MDENKLDNIIELLEAPEELSDKQLAQLVQDDEAMSVAEDILNLKQATARKCHDEHPVLDVDTAWNDLSARLDDETMEVETPVDDDDEQPGDNDRRRRILRHAFYTIAGIAASVVIVLGFYSYLHTPEPQDPHLVYEKDLNADTCVTMTSTSHDEPVEVKGDKQNLAQAPAVRNKIYEALGYSTDDVPTERYTINIPAGKSYQITLPDGTQVWLYANSKLTYPIAFIDHERSVYLEGEAYFKVAHDASHPFVINTDNVEARVLGTELNVSSYKNEPAHVALITGKVVVSGKGGGKPVKLQPGQGVTLQGEGFCVAEENMEGYEFWRNGYIYYDDTPLDVVARAVGRWYNVSVVFDDLQLKNLKIRYFCNRTESLHRAVELFNHFDSFQVKMKDGVLHIYK